MFTLTQRLNRWSINDDVPEKDLLKITRATVRALARNGMKNCCLFGSMACYFYGMSNRTPHDIDILISDTHSHDAEEIKRLIVATDSNFYLVASKNWRATYKVLWYRISDRLSCKVDILIPGTGSTMRLPRIPSDKVVWRTKPQASVSVSGSGTSTQGSSAASQLANTFQYPVMPLLPLILLKVQGWHDYRVATQQYKRDKVGMYAVDINEMLGIANEEIQASGGGLGSDEVYVRVSDCQGWIESAFLERTQRYVREFWRLKSQDRSSLRKWEKLGLTMQA